MPLSLQLKISSIYFLKKCYVLISWGLYSYTHFYIVVLTKMIDIFEQHCKYDLHISSNSLQWLETYKKGFVK